MFLAKASDLILMFDDIRCIQKPKRHISCMLINLICNSSYLHFYCSFLVSIFISFLFLVALWEYIWKGCFLIANKTKVPRCLRNKLELLACGFYFLERVKKWKKVLQIRVIVCPNINCIFSRACNLFKNHSIFKIISLGHH